MSVNQTSNYFTGFQELFSCEGLDFKKRAIGFVKVISYCSIVLPIFYGLALYQAEKKERKYSELNKALDAGAEKSRQAFQDKLLVPHLIEALKRGDGEHFKKGFPLLVAEGQMAFFEKVDKEQFKTIFDLLEDQTEFHINIRSSDQSSNKYVELVEYLKGKSINKLHLRFDYYSDRVSSLLRILQYNPEAKLPETEDFRDFFVVAIHYNISNIAKVLKLVKEIKDSNASLHYEIEFINFKVTHDSTSGSFINAYEVQSFIEGRPIT